MMKNTAEFVPDVIMDESLNHLSGQVLFPEKLKKANAILAKGGLPKEMNLGNEPVFFELPKETSPLGTLIQQTRLQRNLSQEALAALLGVDRTLIFNLENNDNSVSISTILQVFRVLGAELSFVVRLQQ
jgi:DNA-binding XRE family transcriptional regulator